MQSRVQTWTRVRVHLLWAQEHGWALLKMIFLCNSNVHELQDAPSVSWQLKQCFWLFSVHIPSNLCDQWGHLLCYVAGSSLVCFWVNGVSQVSLNAPVLLIWGSSRGGGNSQHWEQAKRCRQLLGAGVWFPKETLNTAGWEGRLISLAKKLSFCNLWLRFILSAGDDKSNSSQMTSESPRNSIQFLHLPLFSSISLSFSESWVWPFTGQLYRSMCSESSE